MFAKSMRGVIAALLCVCMLVAFAGCTGREAASSEVQASSSEAVELTDEYYVDTFLMVDTLDVIYSETSELLLESVSTPTDEEIEAEFAALAEQYQLEIEKIKEMVPAAEVTDSLTTRKAVKVIVDSAVAVAPKAEA